MTVRCNCHYRCPVPDCEARIPHEEQEECGWQCVRANGIRIAQCVECDERGTIINPGETRHKEDTMSERAEQAAKAKRDHAINRLDMLEELADLDREIATARLQYDGTIAADKSLTNETMRKAAKARMEAADERLVNMTIKRDQLAHEIAELAIEITYQDDLLKAYAAS